MATAVDICNDALLELGAERISSLSGSGNAVLCNQFYPTARDVVLESHNWTFKMKRIELALVDGVEPEFGYEYSYQLPTDYLLDVQLEDIDTKYEIVGTYLNCDETEAKLLYLSSGTDTGQYFAMFRQAVVELLKSKLAFIILGTGRKGKMARDDAFERHRYWLDKARAFDAARGNTDMDTTDSWLTVGGFDQSNDNYPTVERS